jgi:hypothetical protein
MLASLMTRFFLRRKTASNVTWLKWIRLDYESVRRGNEIENGKINWVQMIWNNGKEKKRKNKPRAGITESRLQQRPLEKKKNWNLKGSSM